MMIPITKNTIYLVSAMTGLDVSEIQQMTFEAECKLRADNDKKTIMETLGCDEEQLERIKTKIKTISDSLPNDINQKEKLIATYGWIRDRNGNKIPLPYHDDSDHANAVAMRTLLHDPTLLHKMQNWD